MDKPLLARFYPANLTLPTALVAASLLFSTLFLVQTIRQYLRLRHVPGPFLNAITPLCLTYHCLQEDVTTYTYNLCKKYGPLVRVQPNVVVFSDPRTFRRICSTKANYTKGLWFEFSRWDLDRPSCIAMRDNESRRERKNRLLPAWGGQGLEVMESRVDTQVRSFLDLIKRKYTSTPGKLRPMEFGHRAQFFTLDVVTSATFGKPWGFLEKDSDVESYLETSEGITPLFGILGSLPWLVYLMHSWPLRLGLPNDGDKVGFGRLMKFASDAVQKRLEPDDKASEHDLIRAYLRGGIDPEDVVQECITLCVAGSETTSVALRLALVSLLTTPEAYRKLQAEIDEFYASSTETSESVITYADAKKLPYLQAVLREALRLWPPSAGLFTKQVPDTGDTVHGFYLPPGTEIGQSLMGIGRTEATFGTDAEIFRPERWLEAQDEDPERFEDMVAAVDLVFSSGKYMCLGKHIAIMELSKWFVEVLRQYDIAATNNTQPLKMRDPVTFLTKDFWIRFTRRGE